MTFEDLRVWQAARELTRNIYLVTKKNELARDFTLRDQMRKSAISSMSNIAEGYERDGNREFRQFLSISKGSVGELRSQLYVAHDAEYLSDSEFNSLRSNSEGVSRMLSSLMDRTSTNLQGRKYK